MEIRIDYSSLNVCSGLFSLDKFIKTDAPGTLSWLNMVDYLDIDPPPFKEFELSSEVPQCAAAKLNTQGLP